MIQPRALVWAAGHHYGEKVQGVDVNERVRRNGLWAGERGGTGEVRVVRNRLKRIARWPPESREMSGPGL